jgi:hypothetical protein
VKLINNNKLESGLSIFSRPLTASVNLHLNSLALEEGPVIEQKDGIAYINPLFLKSTHVGKVDPTLKDLVDSVIG